MASPFPGMDPYLEANTIWSGFHHSLAEEIRTRLNEHIGPSYYADVEVHTVVEEVQLSTVSRRSVYPDVGVVEPTRGPTAVLDLPEVAIAPAPVQRVALESQSRLRSVRVFVTDSGQLVTAIEILSPYNKRGHGLADYRRKRQELLHAEVHLLELDLLRGGERPGSELEYPPLEGDYFFVLIRSSKNQRISDIWPVRLQDPLPMLPVPLLPPDPDVPLDLNDAIRSVYARAGYDWRIDYSQPAPPPPLRAEQEQWMRTLLTARESND